eukprot:SM000173S03008  [mRNA]  locus=s173:171480:173495:+ [translate_table: standard]
MAAGARELRPRAKAPRRSAAAAADLARFESSDDDAAAGSGATSAAATAAAAAEEAAPVAELSPEDAHAQAFASIMHRRLAPGAEGPILASQKRELAQKLREEGELRKGRSKARREALEVREKAHVLPAAITDGMEKELHRLATRGVVRLFNSVAKAQKVHEEALGADTQTRKAALELSQTILQSGLRGSGESAKKEGDISSQPQWAVLQDSFLLGKPKLKDWDKAPDFALDGVDGEMDGLAQEHDDSDDGE